jgi:hypothetical protein
MWSDAKKVVLLVELTVCFETNYQDAQRWKTTKYLNLADEIGMWEYVADIIPVQVGSRGMVEVEGFERLRLHLNVIAKRQWLDFLVCIAAKTIEASHSIWVERNWKGD